MAKDHGDWGYGRVRDNEIQRSVHVWSILKYDGMIGFMLPILYEAREVTSIVVVWPTTPGRQQARFHDAPTSVSQTKAKFENIS